MNPPKHKVLLAASKKLPMVSDRVLRERLEWAADDMADAYRIGAQEAQAEIVARMRTLYDDRPASP